MPALPSRGRVLRCVHQGRRMVVGTADITGYARVPAFLKDVVHGCPCLESTGLEQLSSRPPPSRGLPTGNPRLFRLPRPNDEGHEEVTHMTLSVLDALTASEVTDASELPCRATTQSSSSPSLRQTSSWPRRCAVHAQSWPNASPERSTATNRGVCGVDNCSYREQSSPVSGHGVGLVSVRLRPDRSSSNTERGRLASPKQTNEGKHLDDHHRSQKQEHGDESHA